MVSPDRVGYIKEIGESWKKQMLLNIVKLRYFDPPTFLDVTSVTNQYEVENQIDASGGVSWPTSRSLYGASANLGGSSRYLDKPTVTYTPLTGQKFTKNLLTPIPPVAVLSMIQNGWPIDVVFSFTVKTINGVRNSSVGKDIGRDKTDFIRLIQAMSTVQCAGVTDVRVEKVNDKDAIVFVISENADKEQYREETDLIRKILKIKPDSKSYKIVSGALAQSNDEIALLTRSIFEIMMEMSMSVEAPAKHVSDKRVRASAVCSGSESMPMHIYSDRDKPVDAFVAVQYQDYWFWIDNKDIFSKRYFALLMIFMSLTESDEKGMPPVFTIS